MTVSSVEDEQSSQSGVERRVRATVGDRRRELRRYREPRGDAGWFGPASVTWDVHAQLGPMLVGGFSALLLQSLHPLVVQGVADHSNYREDPFGRLQRTADFIAGTTYGSSELASSSVRRVRAIHTRVQGHTPDGRQYRADDPALLNYVHVTEVWSFLRAHQRYSGRPLLLSEKNQYLREVAVVARRLGADGVPETTEDVRAYLRVMRPELKRSEAAAQVVEFLLQPVKRPPVEVAAHRVITEAAIDLLPAFARRRLGLFRPHGYRLAMVRPAASVLSLTLRRTVGDPPMLAASRERCS
jgi:uncharacterized protein (DUF2236 family)